MSTPETAIGPDAVQLPLIIDVRGTTPDLVSFTVALRVTPPVALAQASPTCPTDEAADPTPAEGSSETSPAEIVNDHLYLFGKHDFVEQPPNDESGFTRWVNTSRLDVHQGKSTITLVASVFLDDCSAVSQPTASTSLSLSRAIEGATSSESTSSSDEQTTTGTTTNDAGTSTGTGSSTTGSTEGSS